MNSVHHARLSCRSARTEHPDDFAFFLRLHDFMDASKEVESSNRHRALTHHLWFIRRVALPVFGHTYRCSGNGREVNIKDDLERNHLLADFAGRFIPSLADFMDLLPEDAGDEAHFHAFRSRFQPLLEAIPAVEEFLLSPLAVTGMLRSLHVTHNSWMIRQIVPVLYPEAAVFLPLADLEEFSPARMFARMRYADWLSNAAGAPPSAARIVEYRTRKNSLPSPSP